MKKSYLKFVLLPSTNLQISDIDALGSLNTMLKRGLIREGSYNGDINCHLKSLGIDWDGEVPVGAIERFACGLEPEKGNWCIKAHPVTLVPNRDNLVLQPGVGGLIAKQTEIEIIDGLNEYLADRGLLFRWLSPMHWIVESETQYQLDTPDIADVFNQNIGEHLLGGEDSGLWRSIANEIQMWLHHRGIGLVAGEQNEPAPNSLWFWGAGSLNVSSVNSSIDLVVSDSVFVSGLAKLAGISYITPKDFEQKMESHLKQHENIVCFVNDSCETLLLDELDSHLLKPALALQQRGKISTLSVELPGGRSLILGHRDHLKFWRKTAQLEDLLS